MDFWVINAQENPAEPRTVPSRREWRSNTLCENLADRDHKVTRWRSSFSHQAKKQLVTGSQWVAIDNYMHQFIDSPDYRAHIGAARIRNHVVLGQNFLKVAETYDTPPDLIHVGNVPISLCYAAVKYAKKHNRPVVVDVRDLWPDIYVDLIPDKFETLRPPVLKALHLLSFRLNWAFKNATAITGLTTSYLEWGLARAGRERAPQDAVFPMSYPRRDTPPDPKDIAALKERLSLAPKDIVACYIGNIGTQSDFETVIAAVRNLRNRAPNFKVIIAGSGPREADLRAMVRDLPNVIVPGWLQGPEVHALMHLSAIGLIAYKPVPNFLRNIPNKFSEYLAGGLVVACGLEGEMGALVRETNCGFVYEAGQAAQLTQQFTSLLQNPEQLANMGAAACNLHRDRFDGANLYPAFSDYLENTVASKRPKGQQ